MEFYEVARQDAYEPLPIPDVQGITDLSDDDVK